MVLWGASSWVKTVRSGDDTCGSDAASGYASNEVAMICSGDDEG
jgi:hypothetical protein